MALTNNDVLKKLRVALKLRDDDIVEILSLVNFRVSKGEIGSFCRNESHPKYVELQDQILRNFLDGLVIYKRGPMEDKGNRKNAPENPLRRVVPSTTSKTVPAEKESEPIEESTPKKVEEVITPKVQSEPKPQDKKPKSKGSKYNF